MEIGQSVFVQKYECQFNQWYKAHIVDIRVSKRHGSVECCSKNRLEYVVKYSDDTMQVVPLNRIVERL